MNIRSARHDDLPALNALMHSAASYQGRYAAMLEGYHITPAQLQRDEIAVIEDDVGLVGFYSLIVAGEPELDLMFIADSTQGKGIGKLLFRHMIERAGKLGIDKIKIVSHPPAAGFYRRMGADHVGEHPPSGMITWNRPVFRVTVRSSSDF